MNLVTVVTGEDSIINKHLILGFEDPLDYDHIKQMSFSYPYTVLSSVYLDIKEKDNSPEDGNEILFEGPFLHFRSTGHKAYYPIALKYNCLYTARLRVINTVKEIRSIDFDFIYSTCETVPLAGPASLYAVKFMSSQMKKLFTPEKYYIYHVRLTLEQNNHFHRFMVTQDGCSVIELEGTGSRPKKPTKTRLFYKNDEGLLFDFLNINLFDLKLKVIDSIFSKDPRYAGPLYFKTYPWKARY
jgi:hypothetical protein